jgi:hypothetical protein
MAQGQVKISGLPVPFALPAAATLTGAEFVPMDQTVSGVTKTVHATTAQIAALGGGSSSSLPPVTNDLNYWFDASQVLSSAQAYLPVMQNSCPWFSAMTPYAYNSYPNLAVIDSTQLNGKNVASFNGSADYQYANNVAPVLVNSTSFVVFRCTGGVSAAQSFYSSSNGSGGLQFYVDSGVLNFSKAYVANIASDTTTLSNNTWYQCNMTYNSSTYNYAFRVARTASSSGTAAGGYSITGPSIYVGATIGAGQNFLGDIAEMILYTRVLSLAEIQSVEAYLHTKWGV